MMENSATKKNEAHIEKIPKIFNDPQIFFKEIYSEKIDLDNKQKIKRKLKNKIFKIHFFIFRHKWSLNSIQTLILVENFADKYFF